MGTFGTGGAGAGGSGGSDDPSGLLAGRSTSAGPISAEQKALQGQSWQPMGIVGTEPGTGLRAILGCAPCSCRAAFCLFQPPASGRKCAAGTDPGKTESRAEFPQDFLAFSSLLGADEVPVSIPWVLSLTPSPFSLQRARPGGGHLRLRALRG